MPGDISDCQYWGWEGDATGIQWVEVGNSANCPVMHTAAPHNKVSSAKC